MPIEFTARDFACPTCGAAQQEPCRLNSGGQRFQSHTERYDIAQEHQSRMSLQNPTGFKKPARRVLMEDRTEAKEFSS